MSNLIRVSFGMERDFLGLGSGKVLPSGKEESGDSVPARGLGMPWSFPNKVSAIPHFLSFKAVQEDRPRRSVYDHPFASSGLMSVSTADALESKQQPHPGVLQKNLNLENQVGSQFVMTGYPLQHLDARSVRRAHEVGKFPASNQPNHSISVAFSNPVLQSQIAFSGPSVGSSAVKPQPLGGVPVAAPGSFPTICSFIGTTDQKNASKPPGPATQLTIFYAGSVNVFDGISPEQAQAIMLLAGNVPPVSPNTTLPAPKGQGPIIMPSGGDGFIGNQAHTSQPGSGLPTPISASSNVGSQPGGGPNSIDELMAGKTKGALTSTNQPEPPNVVTSLGSTTPTYIPAVPQARKASLARFLEKRKERMMSASPYNGSTPASNVVGFSMNSALC